MAVADSGVPVGTVTFLLTDIEASTRLWNERTAEMPDAVARHYAVLDAVVRRHGGVRPVEQGEGDSVVAAFAVARDAVHAALDAQLALAGELPWLRVRMAVHTGEGVLRDGGNYVGPGIIRCARLRNAGHGGQILVSETAAPLVQAELPAEASLVGLGRVRLRDIGGTELVFQLVHPACPSSFPPLRSALGVPHNLPVPVAPLLGRAAERAELGLMIDGERLVTLTGSGGVGKSRLALHVASDAVDAHGGGVWWIELAPLTSSEQVAESVAAALRVELPASADPLMALAGYLRTVGRVLLVLDNAEHLVAAVADLTNGLLASCPELMVVVTSREPLGVPGEVVFRVPSLALPPEGTLVDALAGFDAAALFLDRARRARPNLVVDPAAAVAIVTICNRLDGIPLAIELAAARCRTVPIARVATGLDDAFGLLTGGARTVLARQQTLLASIAWSVDLLDEPELTVLRRLSVFQATFTIDGAEAVAADGATVEAVAVLDLVARLVDKSLVLLEDDTGRYRMLETVRQFGLDRLREARDLAATRDRHAAWFARWCEDAAWGRHGLRVTPLAAEAPDVVAALDWSYVHTPEVAYAIARHIGPCLSLLGPAAGHRLVDWLLNRDGDDDPAAWAAAAAAVLGAVISLDRSDLAAAIDRMLAHCDPADWKTQVTIESALATPEILHGRTDLIVPWLERFQAEGWVVDVLESQSSIAFVEARSGHLAAADRALDGIREILAGHGLAITADSARYGYEALLNRLMYEGRLDEARAAVSHEPAEPNVMQAAAVGHAHLGWLIGDEELVASGLRWAVGDAGARSGPLRVLTRMFGAMHRGDAQAAADLAVRGLEENKFAGALCGLFPAYRTATLLAVERMEEARAFVDEWREQTAEMGNRPLHVAGVHHGDALVALADGRLGDAADAAHAMLRVAEEHRLGLLVIDALTLLVDIADHRQRPAVAARLAGAAYTARRRIGYLRPLVPDPTAPDALAVRLRSAEPEAFAAGAALDVASAIDFARRSRGQRGRPVVGWASLTPTERQVADLAAAGRANAEIARDLLMSPATVKTHLTRIFGKVGVRNRTELAAAHQPGD